MHCTNGTIDNLAADEAGCFEQIRTVLSYLPDSGTKLPPVIACEDPIDRVSDHLRTIVPRRKERMYNPRKIITEVVDRDSFFEIGALWGTTAIVGLARFGGRPVGVVSMNCEGESIQAYDFTLLTLCSQCRRPRCPRIAKDQSHAKVP